MQPSFWTPSCITHSWSRHSRSTTSFFGMDLHYAHGTWDVILAGRLRVHRNALAFGNSMLYKRRRYPDFAQLCCCASWSSTRNHSRPFCKTSSSLAVTGKHGEHDLTHFQSHWRQRDISLSLEAVVRLFRIVEDVTSPAFTVEDRQWRSSVIDVFRYFFGALWEDERVRNHYQLLRYVC